MIPTDKIRPLSGLLATALLMSAPRTIRAQIVTQQFFACYVPATGTVYLVNRTGAPGGCGGNYGPVSWFDGGDGTRPAPNGWAVTGTLGTGAIPVTGAGVRLMWYSGKGAFRAGRASSNEWDDVNIGDRSIGLGDAPKANGPRSVAIGTSATASGDRSTAIGSQATASGSQSVAIGTVTAATGIQATALGTFTTAGGAGSTALGQQTTASGSQSTAMGSNTTASGSASTAMGGATVASGDGSTAMGTDASTNGHTGSFVYGDRSAFASRTVVLASADNQFVVRAAGGVRFRTSATLSTGCDLPAGSGTFSCTSDRDQKENFRILEGELVLSRIAQLQIQSWNYRTEDPNIRHLGPTAQDFYAAFGLGEDSRTISLVDADGVNLLAIQTLEARTREQAKEIDLLRNQLAALRTQLERRK